MCKVRVWAPPLDRSGKTITEISQLEDRRLRNLLDRVSALTPRATVLSTQGATVALELADADKLCLAEAGLLGEP